MILRDNAVFQRMQYLFLLRAQNIVMSNRDKNRFCDKSGWTWKFRESSIKHKYSSVYMARHIITKPIFHWLQLFKIANDVELFQESGIVNVMVLNHAVIRDSAGIWCFGQMLQIFNWRKRYKLERASLTQTVVSP